MTTDHGDVVDHALRREVDRLCDEAAIIENPTQFEVNYRLRESLLRIADDIKKETS